MGRFLSAIAIGFAIAFLALGDPESALVAGLISIALALWSLPQ